MKLKSRLTDMCKQVKKWQSYSLLAQRLQPSIWQAGGMLDKTLFIIAAIVEYIVAMHIGMILGWFIGLWVGKIYFDHFPPQNISDAFILTKKGFLPYAFTENGAIIGIFVSIMVLAVINKILFSREVTGLYEQGTTNPEEIAQRLSCSVWKVKRIMSKFDKNVRYIETHVAQI